VKEKEGLMTRDEGRAFIRASLDSQFGATHNVSDEGSRLTQFVSFVLMPLAAGARHHVLEVHEDLLDGDELESQLEEARVIDRFRREGVGRLRIPPSGPAEVVEQVE
jgi:hypothetical protein